MGAGLADAVIPVRSALVCEPVGVDELGLGEPASGDKPGVCSANIESTATPPAPAPEASCWPELSPKQERAAARDNARSAVEQFRDAKAHLSAARAVCHSSGEGENQISWWEQQVEILRGGAISATDRYYDFANKALEKAAEAITPDEEWDKALQAGDKQKQDAFRLTRAEYVVAELDVGEADRLRGQAGETMRSFAQQADDAEYRTARPANELTPEEYAKNVRDVKAAAEFAVLQWEKAFADAVLRQDPEEISKCLVGLRNALSEKKPVE